MSIKEIKFYIFLLLSIASIILIFVTGYIGYNTQNIMEILSNSYISIILYILWIALATATTLPITVVLIPGVIIFSFTWAMIYGFIGLLIGGISLMLLTKFLGKSFVKEYASLKGGKVKLFNELIEKNSFELVLVMNCVYFFPSNFAYMIAGLTNLGFSRFIFATILGNFSNFFAVGLITLGIMNGNSFYVAFSILMLLLVTLVPLYLYRRNLKKLILLTFNEKAYKDLVKAEKIIKRDYIPV